MHTAVLYLNVAVPSQPNDSFNDDYGTASPIIYHMMDEKFDDGVARTGLFKSHRTWTSLLGDCLTANDGDYLLTNDQAACMASYTLEK